ncbi:peptidoglycan endopeptidase [Mycobacterium sp.]|uniref:peptidoglycan endopeptidase n=1 Tax=Mycobacterium sp. TaxID=1785 RepID=UPI003C726423
MFAETIMALLDQMSGTPYSHGYSPGGTDCSGLASLVSNVATNRPAFAERFNTGNEESALLARGFQYGTAPGALVIGWNGGHTAVTLPDGTPVSSGERGGVRIGGGGAYQSQFTHHMFLPVDPGASQDAPPPPGAVLADAVAPEPPPPPAPEPAPVEPVQNELPPPPDPAPAPAEPVENQPPAPAPDEPPAAA